MIEDCGRADEALLFTYKKDFNFLPIREEVGVSGESENVFAKSGFRYIHLIGYTQDQI